MELSLVTDKGEINLPPVSLYAEEHRYSHPSQVHLLKLAELIASGKSFDLSDLKVEVKYGWTQFTDSRVDVEAVVGEVFNISVDDEEEDDFLAGLKKGAKPKDKRYGFLNLYLVNSKGVAYKLKAFQMSNLKVWDKALLLLAKLKVKEAEAKGEVYTFNDLISEFTIRVDNLELTPFEDEISTEDFFDF